MNEIILRERVITLKAGEVFDQALQGNVLRVTAGSVPLRVQGRDSQMDFTLLAGERAQFPDEFPALLLSHTSGVDQTFTIQVGKGVDVASALLSGSVTISGVPNVVVNSVTGTVKTDAQAFAFGASYKSNTLLAANTPETIVSPAANVNGIELLNAFSTQQSTAFGSVFIAKTSSPSNVNDGNVIASGSSPGIISGAYVEGVILPRSVIIPPGFGLYFVSAAAQSSAHRSALYKLL